MDYSQKFKEAQEIFSRKDLEEYLQKLRESVMKEKEVKVKIGLIGQPGAGKSSLINTLIGEDVMEISQSTDTTKKEEIVEYKDLIIADLPGYGTKGFPVDQWVKKFDLENYDIFLCVYNGKIHEADEMIFANIKKVGKPYFLIRNKADEIWEKGKSVETVKNEIKSDFLKRFDAKASLFFTSCRTIEGIPELTRAIFSVEFDRLKHKKIIAQFKAFTEEDLKKKREVAEEVVQTRAYLAAANGLNPIPIANIGVDVGILLEMLGEIRSIYGLNDDLLKKWSLLMPVAQRLVETMGKAGVMMLLENIMGRVMAKEVASFIPFIGSLVGMGLGFAIVTYVGEEYISDCEKLTKDIMDEEAPKIA